MKHVVVSSLLTIFIVVPVTYMWADVQPPYVYESGTIEPNVVSAGESVIVRWKIKVNRKCLGLNQRQIVDAAGRIVNYDSTVATGISVNTDFSVTFELPRGLVPGPAKYRVYSAYSCNIIQTIWPMHTVTPDIAFYIK